VIFLPPTGKLGLADYRSASPCSWCQCNLSTMPWNDFNLERAAWLSTTWVSNAAWRAAHPNRHWIFRLPGVGILTQSADLMHVKYMGTDMYTFASIMIYIVRFILPGNADTNLITVWDQIKKYVRSQGMPEVHANMKMSMLMGETFPCMKGKASEMRHLGKPLKHVFSSMMDPSNDMHALIYRALSSSVAIDEILDSHPDSFKLPEVAADALLLETNNHLAFVNTLKVRFMAMDPPMYMFHQTIKSHMLIHCALQARHLHLRLSWCFAGEDFMRLTKRTMASCLRGTKQWNVLRKFLTKYANCIHFRMVRQEDWFEPVSHVD
jgi:hypothetical protein